jgi:hypothetical protein
MIDWLIPAGAFTEHAIVAASAFAVTALAVLVHYEGVHWLARRFSRRKVSRSGDRRAMLKIIFALLGLHLLEIWLYGLAYWGLVRIPGTGSVHGVGGIETLFDAVYLSATTYSTLGFGDLAPLGAIRIVSGMEALTGLLLITWSASFTYLEMSRLWRDGLID